jgi:hypothetical protein
MERFPEKATLFPSALLASIAHGVFIVRAPFLSHEQSWDGPAYNVQDSEGTRGTIVFGRDKISFVGVFFSERSSRSLMAPNMLFKTPSTFLRDLPSQYEQLAELAKQYVLQNVSGVSASIITSAFWSDPDSPYIAAAEPWKHVLENGAFVVGNQLIDVEDALIKWTNNFEFNSSEISLVTSLFKRRMENLIGVIHVTESEKQILENRASGTDGLAACRESLGELGIVFT